MVHVAFVISQGQGGLPHYAAELSNAVAELADVTVFKPSETSADDIFDDSVAVVDAFRPAKLSSAGVRAEGFQPFNNVLGLASHWHLRELRRVDPDVVHFVTNLYPHSRLFSWLFRLDREFPTVVTRHGVRSDPGSDASVLNRVTHTLNGLLPAIDVDRTIVHTDQNKQTLVKRGYNSDAIAVIPHGVYKTFTDYDHSDVEQRSNSALFFGNIVPDGGIGTVLDALPAIVERISEFTLYVAGNGELPPNREHILRAYESNIEVRNEFIPNEEVGYYFKRAELVLVPHLRQTGHSGTLTVAYSFDKPVVATDVGEYDELVADAGCGLVVPPGDESAMADAVVELLEDDKQRHEMATNAGIMTERYSWESIATEHAREYDAIV